jgi:hypothetical protein
MLELINILTPKNVHSEKFRIGPLRDGGYVLNALLENSARKLISMGYGGSDAFEVEWYETYNTPIDIYDGTCGCLGICNKFPDSVGTSIRYIQQNVGYEEGYVSVQDILRNERDVLLKVDIEGSEYTAFDNVDFSNQVGLLLEVHALHIDVYQQKFIHLMNNEFGCFELFHVHANTHGGQFAVGSVAMPTTYELSFVNKRLVHEVSDDTSSYPVHGLDYANDGTDNDLPITDAFNAYKKLHSLYTPVSSALPSRYYDDAVANHT